MEAPRVTFRQASFIEASITTLQGKLIGASVFVAVILFFFLGTLRPLVIALLFGSYATLDYIDGVVARERKLCKRHVSDLFPGWDFTYADMAEYPGVKKLGDGRLNTPALASDYGDPQRYEIDRNGCIVAVLQ